MSKLPEAARGDATRQALVAAATNVFARDGFHAVSTREIARTAKVNQALIGYHFGGKEGLYLAVFDHITQQLQAGLGPVVGVIAEHLQRPAARGVAAAARQREEALQMLLQLLDGMAAMLSSEASAPWAQLIMREQQSPTEAFARLYDGFMGRVLPLVTELVRRVRPQLSLAEAQLVTATFMGQVMVFRIARAGVLRHMGWKQIGSAELAAIQRQVRANVIAILMAKEST